VKSDRQHRPLRLASFLAVTFDLGIRWVFKLLVFSVREHSMTIGAVQAWDDLQLKFGYSILTIVNP